MRNDVVARIFVSRKTGAKVMVRVDNRGVTTWLDSVYGGLRPWAGMKIAPGAKPDWDYASEVRVLKMAGWKEWA